MIRIRNIDGFRSSLLNTAKQIRKAGIKTTRDAANLQVVQAKRLAPYSTGEIIQGIKARPIGRGYRAVSEVSGSFKQNLWANQTAPFRSPKMYWTKPEPFQKVVYGQYPANWTGTPRFWDRAYYLVKRQFPKMALRNTKTALRTGTK